MQENETAAKAEDAQLVTDRVVYENRAEGVTIRADKPDAQYGGASHLYTISIKGAEGEDEYFMSIDFQKGPIKEVGRNGVPDKALLLILQHRLEDFQDSRWACRENASSLEAVGQIIRAQDERTDRRTKAGTEGTGSGN